MIGYNDLSGSKMVVGNFEVRLPFTGPEKLAVIPSGLLFSDLNFFIDGGLAWSNNSIVKWKKTDSDIVNESVNGQNYSSYDPRVTMPVFGEGASAQGGEGGAAGMGVPQGVEDGRWCGGEVVVESG